MYSNLEVKMKSRFILILFVLIVVSCNHNSGSETVADDQTSEGMISITFPARGRGWVNSDVSTYTDKYEIIVYNSDKEISTGIIDETVDGIYVVTVPEGTYDILVIAGTGGTILGFGEVENVLVENDLYTDVNIELNTYSWTTSWPGTVLAGTTFNVSMEIILPVTNVSLDTGSAYSAYLSMEGLPNYFTVTKDVNGNNTFNGSINLEAPVLAGDYNVFLCSTSVFGINLKDDDYSIDKSIYSIKSSSWNFLGYVSIANQYSEFNNTITVIEDTTTEGVSITMGWGAD